MRRSFTWSACNNFYCWLLICLLWFSLRPLLDEILAIRLTRMSWKEVSENPWKRSRSSMAGKNAFCERTCCNKNIKKTHSHSPWLSNFSGCGLLTGHNQSPATWVFLEAGNQSVSMATLTETGRWQAESLREQMKVGSQAAILVYSNMNMKQLPWLMWLISQRGWLFN